MRGAALGTQPAAGLRSVLAGRLALQTHGQLSSFPAAALSLLCAFAPRPPFGCLPPPAPLALQRTQPGLPSRVAEKLAPQLAPRAFHVLILVFLCHSHTGDFFWSLWILDPGSLYCATSPSTFLRNVCLAKSLRCSAFRAAGITSVHHQAQLQSPLWWASADHPGEKCLLGSGDAGHGNFLHPTRTEVTEDGSLHCSESTSCLSC